MRKTLKVIGIALAMILVICIVINHTAAKVAIILLFCMIPGNFPIHIYNRESLK